VSGKPELVGCLLKSLSPVILILNVPQLNFCN